MFLTRKESASVTLHVEEVQRRTSEFLALGEDLERIRCVVQLVVVEQPIGVESSFEIEFVDVSGRRCGDTQGGLLPW